MKKIKLIILDDNKLLREGYRVILKEQPDIQLMAAFGDRVKVLDKIRALKPNVLLLDLSLESQNSLDLVKSLKKAFPLTKVIVMALLPIKADIVQYIAAGAAGFIRKDTTITELMKTIRSVEGIV